MKLSGTVIKKKTGAGSKTEYDAVCLQTNNATVTLRRPDQSPFKDDELEKLVGKNITVNGEMVNNVFFVDDWKTIS